MLEKTLLEKILTRISYGRLEIIYPDASRRRYGKTGPLLTIKVNDLKVIRRLAKNTSIAVGEGYVNEQLSIDEDRLPTLFELIAKNQTHRLMRQPYIRATNRKEKQQKYIAHHYDLGNDYYDLFLDPTRMYSCAYFKKKNDSLEKAQRQKIEHLLRKLRLEPGHRMLDIGCGWGHLAVTAAKMYNVNVLGITLSEKQLEGARELAKKEGMSDKVRFELINYQDLTNKTFDRIISVGMFEHVGKNNHDQYFSKVSELLKDDGVSVLHTITQLLPRPTDAWVDKYIFPGGYLPTVTEIEAGLAKRGLWSVDREDLSLHYANTLRLWRMKHQKNRKKVIAMFDDGRFMGMTGLQFYRMRDFWLAGSEGGFRYGNLGLSQVVFTKGKIQDGPLTREFLYR